MAEISKDIANFSRDPQESTEKNLQEQMLAALGSLVFKAYGSIVWRGEFNLGTSYQVNDFVSFQNSLYICTQENAGELLIEGFWDLMIETPSEVELRVFENNIEWKLESSIVWNHLIAIPSKLSDLEDDATHRLITDTERIKWDESYSWGNHAGIYSPLNHNHSNLYEPLGLALQLLSQHNSAFEHSLIASALQTETDPIFTASAAFSITALNISGWNEAHSWGDHNGLYDALGEAQEAVNDHNDIFDHSLIATALQSETDPIWVAERGSYAKLNQLPTKNSELENDTGFITLGDVPEVPEETDPVWTADKPLYALKTELPTVPTKNSELENDSEFITLEDVPEPTPFNAQTFELELARKTSGNSYMELVKTGDILNGINYWSDSSKATKLFTKTLTYTGDKLTTVSTKDEATNKTLTQTIAYIGDEVESITKVIS